MNEEEREKLKEIEDARADDESDDDTDEPMAPQTGGPGLAGMTPPD